VLATAVAGEVATHAERLGAVPVAARPLDGLAITAADATCAAEPVYDAPERQVAVLVYTSGTTGRPKGVMLTHRNLLFVAAVSGRLRDLQASDRAYGALPIYHVYGLASMLLGTLLAGACLQLVARFSAPAALRAIAEDGLTLFQGVPAMYVRILEALAQDAASPENDRIRHRLRFLYAGGSPLDPTLKREVERRFGVPLHNGYGLTETSPTVSQTRLDAPRTDTSVGPPIPGIEVRIVGVAPDGANGRVHDSGRAHGRGNGSAGASESRSGDVGELWVRGPNVMLGYYRDPAATADAITADGWLRTGDLARQDPDGALFIVGRLKELIIRSGLNVYPVEVESVLNDHPAVSQSVVVGRPAESGNEEVVAFVELVPGRQASAQEILAHAASALAPYKRPCEVVLLPALPASATGKVLRAQLRALAVERAAVSRRESG
jgi:acyl-CoA synthetase (AMP-forming)/AMP-acid ligase II